MRGQRPWATTTHNGRAWSCMLRLGTVLLLGGCATYQPMPLTPQAVDRALAPPEIATLAAQVTTLHNPLLHPVPVDLARGLTPDAAAILAVVGTPPCGASGTVERWRPRSFCRPGCCPTRS